MRITYDKNKKVYVCEYAGIKKRGITRLEALQRVLSVLIYVRG